MIRQKPPKPEMLATIMPTRPEEPLTLAGRNAMTQRNGPNLKPVAKSSRHRKTPALHLSSAPCQEEAGCRLAASQAPQEPLQPDPLAQPLEVDRELENLPPHRRPLKLAPLASAPELKDTQRPARARGGEGGGGGAGEGMAAPSRPESKVGVRKLEGLGGAEACARKVEACPVREASPARSPERALLCRMRPLVEFPKAAPLQQQQQQQPPVGTKTIFLPVPQPERARQKQHVRDQQAFPSSTPPPAPSGRKSGPLSLSVSPTRLPLEALQGAQVATGRTASSASCSSSSSGCNGLAEGAWGRARPRLRRIPRLEEDQGRSAPAPSPAPAKSAAGLSPLEQQEEKGEAKPEQPAQGRGQRAERALREATRMLEKASHRTPGLLDGPEKAGRKVVVNIIPAAVH